jgi:hypothetical protein
MQSHTRDFPFDPNFDLATRNLFIVQRPDEGTPFPPAPGNFLLLDGTDFLLLDGTNFLLL